MIKISVFINTLNEARRIRACLQSVQWADEIVVVDMHSEDDTVAIARGFTDKVFYFDRVGYCEPARKFAAEQTTGDWVLNIDADEIVTLGLKRELLRISGESSYDAVYVPRRNYFWGQEMRFSGCGPLQDRPLRFYRKGAVAFNERIHAGIQLGPSARVYRIEDPLACLLHFSFVSPEQYWAKMDKYTSIEAETLFRSDAPYTLKMALQKAWNAFWKRYVKKGKGHKDGTWGLIYCLWTAVYEINIYAKYVLMKAYRNADYATQIEKKYEGIIQAALDELKEGA